MIEDFRQWKINIPDDAVKSWQNCKICHLKHGNECKWCKLEQSTENYESIVFVARTSQLATELEKVFQILYNFLSLYVKQHSNVQPWIDRYHIMSEWLINTRKEVKLMKEIHTSFIKFVVEKDELTQCLLKHSWINEHLQNMNEMVFLFSFSKNAGFLFLWVCVCICVHLWVVFL